MAVSHGMFLLPWSSGTGSDKVLPRQGKVPTTKPRTSPVIQIPLLNKAKRKRENDGTENENAEIRPIKRRTPEEAPYIPKVPANMDVLVSPAPTFPQGNNDSPSPRPRNSIGKSADVSHVGSGQNASIPETSPEQTMLKNQDCKATPRSLDPGTLTKLQQTIESQFNLEILLKHRELRLIDQELAKCQIALEQLRRCHVMPYPATTSDPTIMSTLSQGAGPSYKSEAEHAPPWGVTEGPYSRHYAKWLMPDPIFGDDTSGESQLRQSGKGLPERASRGGKFQRATGGMSSRAQRGSARERLQALPHGYPEPKENKGPMIVKRSTDGQMVKLVCLDCRREDFNSAQGFINHCRIAHSRGFASHDAAAIACGEETEVDPASGPIGEGPSSASASAGLVHPLIRSAHLTRTNPTIATPLSKKGSEQRGRRSSERNTRHAGLVGVSSKRKPGAILSAAGEKNETPFKPSPHTPHLSALYARSGLGGDLDEMVTEATKKQEPETPLPDDDEEDDQEMEEAPEHMAGHHTLGTRGLLRGGGRLPARSGLSPAPMQRTPSNKSTSTTHRKPGHLHTSLPNTSDAYHFNGPILAEATQSYNHHSTHHDRSPSDTNQTLNLSPNTIESHPAPSLVFDDEDYQNTHSDSDLPSSGAVSEDDDSLDVEVKEHDQHAMDIDEPAESSTADFGLEKAGHGHRPRSNRETAASQPRRPRARARKGGK